MIRVALNNALQKTTITASKASLPALVVLPLRKYHENIVEHYENPRNVGTLDKNDENVGTVSFCINREKIFFSCNISNLTFVTLPHHSFRV